MPFVKWLLGGFHFSRGFLIMENLKHTKGEWLIKDDFREPKVINESGQVIFTHNINCYDSDGDNNTHKYYSHNKMMANAKLIAAAPDLLEALIKLNDYFFCEKEISSDEYSDLITLTQIAINKATK